MTHCSFNVRRIEIIKQPRANNTYCLLVFTGLVSDSIKEQWLLITLMSHILMLIPRDDWSRPKDQYRSTELQSKETRTCGQQPATINAAHVTDLPVIELINSNSIKMDYNTCGNWRVGLCVLVLQFSRSLWYAYNKDINQSSFLHWTLS